MYRDIEFHKNRAEKFISELSFDDKIKIMYGSFIEKKELKVPFIDFLSEAAHGVQARHDQSFDLGLPAFTTVFPNPIGMAASFDKKLMHRIGNVVGTEMRSLLNEYRHNGLLGLAPTVDMERDPRWGRNEEAYGEDPHLTSRMAGEYILGMAGDDERFVRCGATLKHFYANNYEKERYSANSALPEGLKEDYYLRVFKEIIEYASPLSVMTSYNQINGVTATFNPEVKFLLREWGVPMIMSDAFTLFFSVEAQHTADDFPDAIRKAFDAGVDLFLEDNKNEIPAMKEAIEKGIVTESDIDTALINRFTVYSMLGMMEEDLLFEFTEKDNPVDPVSGEVIPFVSSKAFPRSEYNITKVDTPESRALAREAETKSVVLLKNDGMLPLRNIDNKISEINDDMTESKGVFAFGPLVDEAPIDWYSGLPSHKVTLMEAINSAADDLIPRIIIKLSDGMYAGLKDSKVVPVAKEDAEVFKIMLWDDTRITLKSESSEKYLTSISPDVKIVNVENEEEVGLDNDNTTSDKTITLYSTADAPFSWSVNEAFQMIDNKGEVIHFNEADFDSNLDFWTNENITGIRNVDGCLNLTFETVESVSDIFERVVEEAKLSESTNILACFGLHPIVNCKEERDRESIELPPFQRAVLRMLRKNFHNICLILLANAPLAIVEEDESPEIRSILWTAFGSEELGNGLLDILTGKISPSGRLPQTWYRGDYQLSDINDYDIKKNGMTYLYMTDKPLYRFGYGLTYTSFQVSFSNAKDEHTDKETSIQNNKKLDICIKNVGEYTSDYVVQIYESPDHTFYLYAEDPLGKDVNGEEIPIGSSLVAFERVYDIETGEERYVKIEIYK